MMDKSITAEHAENIKQQIDEALREIEKPRRLSYYKGRLL